MENAPALETSSRDFSRYLRNFTLATALMILAVVTINFVVDPFNRNALFDLALNKDRVSFIINQRLYKILEFDQSPKSKIIVGDSRIRTIDVDVMESMGHAGWYNFAFGGSSFRETLETIRLLRDRVDLETLVIGVPFGRFDPNDGANLLGQVRTLVDSDIAYYTSLFVLKASFANLYNKVTGLLLRGVEPPLSRDAWWQYQLRAAQSRLDEYREDESLKRELKEMVRDLRQEGVEVIILLPPSHAEVREMYLESASEDYAEFKEFIYSLGHVIDFDIDSSFNSRAENFADPIHIDSEQLPEIISNMFEQDRDISVHVD